MTDDGSSRPGSGQDADPYAPSLIGRWEKASCVGTCAHDYPDVIRFSEGTYLGSKGPGQGFVLWDAGIYSRPSADSLRLSTATDELMTYQCSVSATQLTVTAGPDCHLEYRRLPDADAGDRSSDVTTKERT